MIVWGFRGLPLGEGVASNEVRVRGRVASLMSFVFDIFLSENKTHFPLLINDKTDAEKVRHDIKNRSLIDETDRH